ncbi:MAG: lysine-2,3-aminomutase-like protein [Beijerinckiaceae bacterium]
MRDDPAPSRPIRAPAELAQAGLVDPARAAALEAVTARYAMAITPAMARLIDPADPNDPIARQFVPDLRELDARPHEREDPIGDAVHAPVEGIVHRYPDRVLLKLLHACPVYCRFCFRRESVGPGGEALSQDALARALDYVRADPRIWETILTGGDPLAMSARRLREVARALGDIAHVRIMRVHTRVPVVAPERIDAEMIDALKAFGRSVYVALHANHPRELTPQARAACARLVDAGLAMVSQTVLLKGVNDDPEVLGDLMRAFVECRVKPYYLHHADLAPGTAHLRVDLARGREIVAALRGRLSGLCQPHYVLDAPGGFGKAPVAASAAEPYGENRWRVTDFQGRAHDYEDPA